MLCWQPFTRDRAPSFFLNTEHLSQADLQRRLTTEPPFHVFITCEVHKQTGEAAYGNEAPVAALFAGCKPQGNFYLIAAPSTMEEACKTKNQPEVAFRLMESGEVKDVILTRASGDLSVDRTVLQMVRNRRYPANSCGVCSVLPECQWTSPVDKSS
ncbi:MAG: energy transducer TonB family protein [Terriglobales bacterium]